MKKMHTVCSRRNGYSLEMYFVVVVVGGQVGYHRSVRPGSIKSLAMVVAVWRWISSCVKTLALTMKCGEMMGGKKQCSRKGKEEKFQGWKKKWKSVRKGETEPRIRICEPMSSFLNRLYIRKTLRDSCIPSHFLAPHTLLLYPSCISGIIQNFHTRQSRIGFQPIRFICWWGRRF